MLARLWWRAWSPTWRLLTIAVLMLLAHSLWGYVEARRFEAIARRIQAETPRYPGARPWNTDPQDAGRFYRAAWALAIRPPKHTGLWSVQRVTGRSALQRQRDQEWLATMQSALQMSDHAATLPSCCTPWNEDPLRRTGLSEVFRAGALRTRENLDAGNSSGALQSLISSFQHLRALAPDALGQYVWPRNVLAVLDDTQYFLDRSQPGQERARLQSLVDAQIEANPIEAALVAQRARTLDGIRSSIACGFSGASASRSPYLNSWLMRPSMRHAAVTALTHMSDAIAASRAPWPERIRRLGEMPRPGGNARFFGAQDLKRLAHAMGRSTAFVHAMSICLQVEQHRFKHGSVPEALDISAPIDPFTGQPLKYRRDDMGYVVYSVGEDGKDDGGSIEGGRHEPGVWSGRLPKDYGYRIRTRMSAINDLK
jgi:hypothetical protein